MLLYYHHISGKPCESLESRIRKRKSSQIYFDTKSAKPQVKWEKEKQKIVKLNIKHAVLYTKRSKSVAENLKTRLFCVKSSFVEGVNL